jgi:hypothetical protein
VSFGAWLSSPLFLSYLRRFVLLWIAGKLANAATASVIGISPFSFRAGTELVILLFELGALIAFIKRDNEDILLGNVGLRLSVALAPLVMVHLALSAALAMVAR